jgi:hypothetical protein
MIVVFVVKHHNSRLTPHSLQALRVAKLKKRSDTQVFPFPLLSFRTAHTATHQQPCLRNQHSQRTMNEAAKKTHNPFPFPHNPFPFPHNPFPFPHNPFTFPPPRGGALLKSTGTVPLKSNLRVVMRHSVELMDVPRQRRRDGRRVTVSMMLNAQHII